jgi:cyclase
MLADARLVRLTEMGARLPGRLGALSRYVGAMFAPSDFADLQLRHPDRAFSGEETLDVGARELRLIEVGPAHTAGDLIVHVPDAAVVFAADVLFVGSTPVMWHGPYESWLRAIDTLLELEADVYVPGHGPPCGADGVREFRELMVAVHAGAREHHDAGRPPAAATLALLTSPELARWRSWQCPERLFITVAAMYRAFDGATRLPTSPIGRTRVMAAVGRLAGELSAASS